MMYFSDDKQTYIIDACNTTSRYLDDIFRVLTIGFILLQYPVVYTVESLSLFYLLFYISICIY